MDPKKRPFCNAFTGKLYHPLTSSHLTLLSGCGRKRSNIPALTGNGETVEESIASLVELSGEPAVEDLTRQIMSEAKLWEAIQEANVELARHKQNDDEAMGVRNGATACAIPPCYV